MISLVDLGSVAKITDKKQRLYFLSLSKDRAHQDDKVVRRQANIQELVALKDSERRLQHELQITKEQLRSEQLKYREATQKVENEKMKRTSS